MDVLRELDHDRKTLMKEIVTIKEELSSSDGLGPTQNLIGLMDTSEDREEIRQRIKGRIRELISSIVVEIKVDGQKRWAKVEVTLTIARYSAAISGGLREVTRRDRGGIAGRWTKPAVASPVCDVASEAGSLSRTRLGELYAA